jgi:hypothetical protein
MLRNSLLSQVVASGVDVEQNVVAMGVETGLESAMFAR